jgi:hypothetical protein
MKITTVILLLGFFVSAAKADLIFKCLVETSSGQSFEETIKQTDTKMRIDAPQASIIESSTTNIATLLIHATKTYSNADGETLRILLSLAGQLGGKLKPENLIATGRTETINGYPTREFKGVIAGIQIRSFVTESFPLEKKVREMSRKWQNSIAADAFQDLMVGMNAGFSSGLAIRIVYEILGTTYSTTLESLEEVRLDDNEFKVPNNYQEVPFPLGH